MPWLRWPPCGEREAHDRVARLQQRVVDGGVGLRARVRLDVGVLGAEQRLRAVDRELLDDVDVLAAAVVALARVALGVLVREHAALALEDRLRHEVLRGDHLQRPLLALELATEGLGDLGVDIGERALEEVGRQIGHRPRTVATASAATAPLPQRPARRPPPRSARRSITVDGVPGQLAAVEDEVGAVADAPPGRRRAAARRRPPERFAELCRTGSGDRRRSGPPGTRRPSVAGSGPQASGQRRRGLGSSSVTPPGSSARERRARARRRARAARRARLAVEEHDRGGLVRRAALERVEALDRGRRARVAGEAVDRVGREDGDAARGDGARRTRRRRAAPGGRGRPPAGHGRRPTTTRSRPARSRTRHVARSPPRGSAPRPPAPAPARSRARRARRRRARGGQEPADDVQPVRARRAARARARSRRSRARAARRPPRRAGWRRPRRRRSPAPASRSPSRKSTSSPSRSAFARATSSASALASVATTSRSGRSCLQRQGDRARAGPDVADPRAARQVERRLDEVLGLRPRDQHARVDVELDRPEALAAEDVGDRLAVAPARGEAHERGARRPARAPGPGRRRSAARSTPIAAASSSSASSRGDSTPAAVSAISAGVQRVADDGLGERAARHRRSASRARSRSSLEPDLEEDEGDARASHRSRRPPRRLMSSVWSPTAARTAPRTISAPASAKRSRAGPAPVGLRRLRHRAGAASRRPGARR